MDNNSSQDLHLEMIDQDGMTRFTFPKKDFGARLWISNMISWIEKAIFAV